MSQLNFLKTLDMCLQKNPELRHLVAAAIREYGQANEDWTYAELKVPDNELVATDVDEIQIALSFDCTTWKLRVPLDQPAEGPKEPPPLSESDVCNNCRRPVYLAPREIVWVHEGSGKSSCLKGKGEVAVPRHRLLVSIRRA